jgi:catechol 2,3-dioxygenase-like lactoylglutathione lyase family enzyme
MQFTQIKETCFYSSKLSAIKHFYHEILGLPIIAEAENKLIFFRAGTSVLLCFNPEYSKHQKVPPPHYAEGNLHFAFEVEANLYEQSKIELEQKGISIEYEHLWPSGKKSAYFSDPDGNVLEIVPAGLWDRLK